MEMHPSNFQLSVNSGFLRTRERSHSSDAAAAAAAAAATAGTSRTFYSPRFFPHLNLQISFSPSSQV